MRAPKEGVTVAILRAAGRVHIVIRRNAGVDPRGRPLTDAERLVALDVIEGFSRREIARRRGVSERTISNQLASVYAKLGGIGRADLFALGRRRFEERCAAASRHERPTARELSK